MDTFSLRDTMIGKRTFVHFLDQGHTVKHIRLVSRGRDFHKAFTLGWMKNGAHAVPHQSRLNTLTL